MKYVFTIARILVPLFFLMSVTQTAHSGTRTDDIAESYPQSVSYIIKRKGKDIGTHSLTFERASDGLKVFVESTINVKILGLSVFKFNYLAVETWQDQRLLNVDVSVNENGKKWENSLSNTFPNDKMMADIEGAKLSSTQANNQTTNQLGHEMANRATAFNNVTSLLFRNGKPEPSELLSFPSNHWHSGVIEQTVIYNTLTGKPAKVQINKTNTETLSLPIGNVDATRYTYSGDIDANSWYDNQGRWVKLEFKREDGALISYNLNTQMAKQ